MVIKEIPLKSKHVRWNYEKSEESFHMNDFLTRYYFAIVDDRKAYRKNTLSKIVSQMTQTNSWVMPIGSEKNIEVKGSKWGLLFVCYDALVSPESLNFSKLGIANKRDLGMSKKEVLNIEDYLIRIYE